MAPKKQHHYQVLPGIQISQDHRGCLRVKGDITNNKQLTTNDLVDVIDKNTFKWLGRWDQVINTGGYKVHPESLEAKIQEILRSLDLSVDYLVTGLPHPKWGQQVVLVLEIEPLPGPIESKLSTLLKNSLHPYEVPKQIQYLKLFPQN